MNLVEEAKLRLKEENYIEAVKLLNKHIDDHFDDGEALHLLGYALMYVESIGLAYQINKRAVEVNPNNAGALHNIAKCLHDRQKDDEADEYFRKAVKVKPNFPNALEGLSMSCLNRGDFDGCISYANRALAETPEAIDARINRGMAYLALKRWGEGWRDYQANLGIEKNRKEMKYGSESRWDGTKGLNVVAYFDQGIGDEISFASCLPDLIRDSKHVTIECDKRVAKLFRRSFPQATVHGTRYKPDEERTWVKDVRFDARVAGSELPLFYRRRDSDFHGRPYLIPRPDIAAQWRGCFDSLGKRPTIGIAWTGGIPKTGQGKRSVTLETLAPIIKSVDANWVSLQYKDVDGLEEFEKKHGVKIHDWEWGTRYWDYDQTVALISELDLVISVTTAVVDAAAAIGKECWCLVPKAPMWRHMAAGDWFPWGSSVKLYRQVEDWPIQRIVKDLKEKFPDHSADGRNEARKEAA